MESVVMGGRRGERRGYKLGTVGELRQLWRRKVGEGNVWVEFVGCTYG